MDVFILVESLLEVPEETSIYPEIFPRYVYLGVTPIK